MRRHPPRVSEVCAAPAATPHLRQPPPPAAVARGGKLEKQVFMFNLNLKNQKIMINYKVVERENPLTQEKMFYAMADTVTPMTLDEVAELIEKRCTLSSADVKAVLDALQFEVLHALLDGKSVRLGDLGSFRPTVSSKSANSADEFDSSNIKRVRVRFTPSAELSDRLRTDRVQLRNVTASTASTADEAAGV